MKKFYLLLLVAGFAFSSCKKEDDPVKGCTDGMAQNFNGSAAEDDGSCEYMASTTPENRKVVLEDFTGVKCGYCPDGHKRALALQAAFPEDVIILAVHAKAYGTPYGSDPYLVTDYAAPLVTQANVRGYPAGTVNRYQFNAAKDEAPYYPQNPQSLALGRIGWDAAGRFILESSSPVNVAVKSDYDEATNSTNITVELYFTETTTSNTTLNVAIVEDGIMTKQADYSVNKVVDYEQNNVLRELVTGQWGEEIPAAEAGTRIQKKYSYTLDGGQVLENIDILAFVSENHENIYNADRVDVK